MFNQSHDFWFGLAIIVWYFFLLLDFATTRYGIWYKGFAEGNPFWLKVFGAKGVHFIFGTAGGSFLDGLARTGLVFGYCMVSKHLGFVNDSAAWMPFIFAALVAIAPIRNIVKIYKTKS